MKEAITACLRKVRDSVSREDLRTVQTLTACAVAELGALGICVYTVLYCSTKTTRFILDLEVLLVLGKDVRDFLLPVRCLLPLALGHGANQDADVKKKLVAVTQWESADSGGKGDGAAQLLDGLYVAIFCYFRCRGRTIRRRAKEWAT